MHLISAFHNFPTGTTLSILSSALVEFTQIEEVKQCLWQHVLKYLQKSS